MNIKSIQTVLIVALLFSPSSCTDIPSDQQTSVLGKVDFPNSGQDAAQADFIEGLLFLHSFEYDRARASFLKAQKIDPTFAMAYWGEALTHDRPLWADQRQAEGQAALLKLGSDSDERSQKTPTQRERAYILAVETLFGLTGQSRDKTEYERDVLYRDRMQELYTAYPDDLEATVLYGLSILAVGSSDREYATYMKAAAVITPVWEVNRDHPGAAHYLIHAYDDPVHAILGLPMARAYSKIAPNAAHAQHMTSHIFVALGLWDDVVRANLRALDVASTATMDTDVLSREECHYTYWLAYSRLQQGEAEEARAILEQMRNRLGNNPSEREKAYFGAVFARYVIDTQDWDAAATLAAAKSIAIPTAHYNFALSYAAIKVGDLEVAQSLINRIESGGGGNPEIRLADNEVEILRLELRALVELAKGNGDSAISLATKANIDELKMPFRFGPPRLIKPTGELLGDILLELGRTEEASDAYKAQLARTPNRANSLSGLNRSLVE